MFWELQDLIEVTQSSNGAEAQLKNLEYNLTSAIKKVVYGFQSVDSILAALDKPVVLTLFISQATLPQNKSEIAATIDKVAGDIQQQSQGKFIYQW